VVQFDTTLQEFNMREAEADLAEAEQQVIQAQAASEATEQEALYTIVASKAEVEVAALEIRKNPTLERIKARQNEIALEAAQNRAPGGAGLRQQEGTTSAAWRSSRQRRTRLALAETARKNIEMMTLRAKSSGYVNAIEHQPEHFWGCWLTLPGGRYDARRDGRGADST
jgi:multidrug resistance efflux pump